MGFRIFIMRTDVNACNCSQGCPDTCGKSTPEVDSRRKISCRTKELNLPQRNASLDTIPTKLHPHLPVWWSRLWRWLVFQISQWSGVWGQPLSRPGLQRPLPLPRLQLQGNQTPFTNSHNCFGSEWWHSCDSFHNDRLPTRTPVTWMGYRTGDCNLSCVYFFCLPQLIIFMWEMWVALLEESQQ